MPIKKPEEPKPGKRVWILGAGFSRPLGAPLLDDLLRPNAARHLDVTYQGKHETLILLGQPEADRTRIFGGDCDRLHA